MPTPPRAARPTPGSRRIRPTGGMRHQATHYLALDIGGTTTRLARCSSLAASALTQLDAYPTPQSYDEHLSYLSGLLRSIQDTYGAIRGIGVSLGGRISRDGASVAVAPNLPQYEGRLLARDLAAIGACEARLAHDTVCGLLGERRFGALRGVDRCAYLTISTGTGAAVYLGGGANGQALSIEIGHQLLDGNTRECLCGQTGCLETYTGGRQLTLRYGRPIEEIAEPAIWQALVEKLALGLVSLAHLTRVEVIAIGGGIALHRPELLSWLQAEVDARLRNAALRLLPATLEDRAPLVGAVQLFAPQTPILLH